MNRVVEYAQFHTDLFAGGLNIKGSGISSNDSTTLWSDLKMKCSEIGVFIHIVTKMRPRGDEIFVPWSNVKSVRLAPESTPVVPKSAPTLKVAM